MRTGMVDVKLCDECLRLLIPPCLLSVSSLSLIVIDLISDIVVSRLG